MELLGQEKADKWRTILYLIASTSSELFTDIALAPIETVKVCIQT